MDITILAAVVLAGILLESFVSERAQGRAKLDNATNDQLASCLERASEQEGAGAHQRLVDPLLG